MNNYINIQKKHLYDIPKKLKNIFRLDIIQIHKLLEVSQYCIMAFFLALIFSTHINEFIIQDRLKLRSISTSNLILKISGYTILIAIAAKYVPKIIAVIPFIFHWSEKYKPNFHGEANYGINLSMGLAFYGVIYNYYAIVEELAFRLFPNAQRLTGPATQMCQDDDNKYIQAHPSCDTLKIKQVFHDVD